MSEPRRLNTGGAEQQQYEEARRLAQQQSVVRGGRRPRRIQTNSVHPVTPEDQARIAAQARAAIEAETAQPQTEAAPELTRAQQQALALQRAAAQRRSRAASAPPVQQLDLNKAQASKPAYDSENDPAFAEHQQRRAARQASAMAQAGAARRPAPVQRASTQPAQTRPAAQTAQPAQPRQAAPAAQAPQSRQPRQAQPAAQPAAAQAAAAQASAQSRPAPRQAARAARDPEDAPRGSRKAAPKAAAKSGKAAPAKGGSGGGKGGKGGRDGKNGGGSGGKKKKKGGWWKILLATLAVIGLIVFGTFQVIMNALRPETGGNITLSQLLNTPKEYADKEFNVLLVGIDRSSESEANPDKEVNDGMTDMIMWLHFNNETGEVKMLQIPRNIFVSKDASFSANYQINAIAKTQGSNGYNDINALCTYVSQAFKVSIDGYVTIRLEKLVELVDVIGGVQINVPYDMDDGKGSHLDAGYQTLDGAACEFFLRTRHIYSNGDLGRLNMQRYFYAAMFAKLRSMSMWDIAKNLPFYLSMVETSLDASELVSVAVSLLKVSSDKIMLAQVPVYMGSIYWPLNVEQPNDVVVAARQETADLLNTYYRENTGPVDASELDICDGDSAPDYSGRTASDPTVQYMGQLNAEALDAMENNNRDGSGTEVGAGEYVYDVPETDTGAESGDTADTGGEEPAA